MIDDVAYLLFGIAIGFPLAVGPGPVLRRTIRHSGELGARAGIRAAAGRVLADLLAICTFGAYALLGYSLPEPWPAVIGVLAGLMLVSLGFLLMDRPIVGTLSPQQSGDDFRERHPNPVLDRFAATVLSPPWNVFWMTAGYTVVTMAATRGAEVLVVFTIGYVTPGLLWPTYVAARLRSGRRENALKDRQYRILTSLSGLGLAAIGFWLGYLALMDAGIGKALGSVVALVFGRAEA